MRISDWSSDVCSSDLAADALHPFRRPRRSGRCGTPGREGAAQKGRITKLGDHGIVGHSQFLIAMRSRPARHRLRRPRPDSGKIGRAHAELQSLMRISYAVFCLKKKKQTDTDNETQ